MSMQMRPNKVGWVLVAFFFFGGLAFTMSRYTRLLGTIWVVVAVFLAVLYTVMSRRADAKDELWTTGIPGNATILDLAQTGTMVNGQPRMKLRLRIEAEGIPPYEISKKMVVPLAAVGALSGNQTIPVRVDPKDRKNFALGFMAATHAPSIDLKSHPAAREAVLKALREHGIDVAHQAAADDPTTPIQGSDAPFDRLQKLQQLKDANLITPEEFLEHRKRILSDI